MPRRRRSLSDVGDRAARIEHQMRGVTPVRRRVTPAFCLHRNILLTGPAWPSKDVHQTGSTSRDGPGQQDSGGLMRCGALIYGE